MRCAECALPVFTSFFQNHIFWIQLFFADCLIQSGKKCWEPNFGFDCLAHFWAYPVNSTSEVSQSVWLFELSCLCYSHKRSLNSAFHASPCEGSFEFGLGFSASLIQRGWKLSLTSPYVQILCFSQSWETLACHLSNYVHMFATPAPLPLL